VLPILSSVESAENVPVDADLNQSSVVLHRESLNSSEADMGGVTTPSSIVQC
jgi:hypothetical protein